MTANTPDPKTWRIGLTGGIGSGKSTVAALLREHGAAVIDADAISRSLTAPGGQALAPIAGTFGAHMLLPDGSLNRAAMRERIFADPQARAQLEAIIHPLVSQITQTQAREALAQGHRVLVFDVPLLVEHIGRWRPGLDRIWVVDCEPETQIQRVMARSGLTREEVQRIIGQQASRAERLACADIVTRNEGLSLQALEAEVVKTAKMFGL